MLLSLILRPLLLDAQAWLVPATFAAVVGVLLVVWIQSVLARLRQRREDREQAVREDWTRRVGAQGGGQWR